MAVPNSAPDSLTPKNSKAPDEELVEALGTVLALVDPVGVPLLLQLLALGTVAADAAVAAATAKAKKRILIQRVKKNSISKRLSKSIYKN